MWYKPNCPRRSTYQTWQDIGKLYTYLSGVAKTVEADANLTPVMEWLNETFEDHREMLLLQIAPVMMMMVEMLGHHRIFSAFKR